MKASKQPKPLSHKELRVLEFIEQFMQSEFVAPTYNEIREHFGFASLNSVQRYLKQLQDKNYIHLPGDNQKRALTILHSSRSVSNLLMDRMSDLAAIPTSQFPSQTQPKKEIPQASFPPSVESLSLPILGRVAAGSPIEAFTHDEHVEVPASLVRNPAKTFALIVQGQSMIEDGILDGDIIFVQKQSYANNGETVVAMVNNQATVKRFYLHKDKLTTKDIHSNPQDHAQESQIELRPANAAMDSMWFSPQLVHVQGVVVGLIRRL